MSWANFHWENKQFTDSRNYRHEFLQTQSTESHAEAKSDNKEPVYIQGFTPAMIFLTFIFEWQNYVIPKRCTLLYFIR